MTMAMKASALPPSAIWASVAVASAGSEIGSDPGGEVGFAVSNEAAKFGVAWAGAGKAKTFEGAFGEPQELGCVLLIVELHCIAVPFIGPHARNRSDDGTG